MTAAEGPYRRRTMSRVHGVHWRWPTTDVYDLGSLRGAVENGSGVESKFAVELIPKYTSSHFPPFSSRALAFRTVNLCQNSTCNFPNTTHRI